MNCGSPLAASRAPRGRRFTFLAVALTLSVVVTSLVAVDARAACPTVTITPATLPDAAQNVTFTVRLAASGGTAPYKFAFANTGGPTPPPWLSLATDGTLSGTPPVAGSFTFSVEAQDAFGCTGLQNYVLNVSGPSFTVDFSFSTADFQPGTPITFEGSVNPSSTAISSWSWDFGDGTTDVGQKVSHAFKAGGSYAVKLTAVQEKTGSSQSVTKPITITTPPPFTIDYTWSAETRVGTAITFTGSVNPTTTAIKDWSWDFGDGTTGSGQVVSHTYTVSGSGFFNVKLTATDGTNTASVTKPVTVSPQCPTISVGPPSLPNATRNSPYSQTLTVIGGTAPYSFSFLDVPPSWLTLSPNGVLSGMPAAAGVFSFTIEVVDANKCSGKQTFTLTVEECPAIGISPATLPDATQNTFYSQTLTASGGKSPYTFALSGSSGPVPAWLTLSSGGTLSGTPTSAGTFSFGITVTDSTGCATTQAFTIRVAAVLTIDFTPVTGVAGTPVNFTASVTPSTTPIKSWSWEFGDGVSGSGQSVSHTYAAAATYTVKLTAVDGDSGATVTVSKPVSISTAPAKFTIDFTPVSGVAGTAITFTGTVTPSTTPIKSWTWEFGDGASGSGQSVTHTYAAAATYTVKVTAVDGDSGAAISIAKAVTITAPLSFTIDFTPTSGTVGVAVAFAGTVDPPKTVITTWSWDFGDNSSDKGQSVSHVFTSEGFFRVTLSASDGTTTVSVSKFVTITKPDSTFTVDFTPVSGAAGSPVTFTGSVNPASTAISGWSWTFGDGTSASGQTVTHTFSGPGSYDVKLSATSSAGVTNSITKPVVISQTCAALVLGPASLPAATENVAFSQTITVSGGVPPYVFTLGTGAPSWLTLSPSGVLSGTPPAAGSFTFTIEVVDKAGCSGKQSYSLVVNKAPSCPTITIGPAVLPNATAGTAYKEALTATGGTAPHTFTLLSGSLGGGLTLSADGTIAGTPAAAGSFAFTVGVTDAEKCAASRSYTIVVSTGKECLDKPSLIAPADGTSNVANPVTFSWSAVAGATAYKLFAFASGTTPFAIITTRDTTYTAYVPTGKVEWYVVATSSGCPDAESLHRTFTTSSCNSAAPVTTSPANGAVDVTLPVTFRWTAVSGATGYNVLMASSTGGSPTLIGSTSGATELTSASLPAGTIKWSVQAVFASCPSVESAQSSFTLATTPTCGDVPATLLTPADGATNVALPVAFTWSAVKGASGYKVWATYGSDSAKVIASVRDTAVTMPVPSGKIEWYVEATFTACPSLYSKHFTFTVAEAVVCGDAAPPKLTAPAEGATNVTSPVTFQWTAVTNATGYKVWGSTGAAGTLPVLFGTSVQTQLTTSVPQGTIKWYVEALFASCPSVVSATATFTVASPTDCSKNTAPALIAPAAGATNVAPPVQFTWSAATGAIGYRLFVAVNGGTFDLVATTTAETSVSRLVPDGTIQWYVEALFSGCQAQASPKSSFTAKQPLQCPTGTIALTSPANGVTVSSPVSFAWSGIGGASTYRVWLAVDGGAPAIVASAAQPSASAPVPSGAAEWYVEAVFSQECPSILSARGRFTVAKAVTCADNKPVSLTAPAEGASSVKSPVAFAWTASTGAIAYRVWVSVAGGPAADIATTKETRATSAVEPGAVEWYVDAVFDGCPPVSSAKGHFTIPKPVTCSNESPVTISPADGATAVKSPVTFLWSAPPNAIGYRVFASLDGASPTLIGAPTEASLTAQVPPGSITWFVNAIFAGCSDTQSVPARFTVPKETTCSADAPAPLTPADNATIADANVTFAWTPVSNAVGYQLWVQAGDGNATPLGAMTTSTQAVHALTPGAIEWFVQAFFSGCNPTSSKHAKFAIPAPEACDNLRPLLFSPPDGATNVASPLQLSWTSVAQATGYKLWANVDDGGWSVIGSTTATAYITFLPAGSIKWYVEAVFASCPPRSSAPSHFTVPQSTPSCPTLDKPMITVAGQVQSGTTYSVRWTAIAGANLYELQEATSADFSGVVTTPTTSLAADYNRTVTAATQYFYRVRAVSGCSDERGPYSEVVRIVVTPPPASSQVVFNSSAEVGNQKVVVQTVFVPGFTTPVQFTAEVDKPWLTVRPSSGTLPTTGLTLTVEADPAALPLGTNTGTVILKYTGSGKTAATPNGTTPPATVPISVSVVTPVGPVPRSAPGPDSLIIPAVGHTEGANNAKFQSDVRVTNVSAQTMKYLLNFTPSGPTGLQSLKQTLIQIDPGQTTALDDILSSFFGVGATAANASALGVLEIRPLTSSTTGLTSATSRVSAVTVASSRTYNLTSTGSTFGQFIPAVAFAQFIGKSSDPLKPNILSLQQLAQARDDSSGYRTNFALVEAAGEAADVVVSVYSKDNVLLGQIPLSLAPGEHRQINRFLAANNIFVDEARVEVRVTSTTGKVTAYASVIDNRTNDPLLVSPVLVSSATSQRYVIPGVADLNNGVQNWRSDIRLFNPSSSTVAASLVYYKLGEGVPTKTIDIVLNPGEVRAIDDALRSFFGLTATGGAVHVVLDRSASLVVTARTFTDDQSSSGTYGQFIPAVTPAESVGVNDGALHVLQLEQSARFRTNLGIAETTGNPVTIELTVTLPDSRVTPKVQMELAANEYRQIPVLTSLGLTTVYNARVSVRVVSGSGKVTAYGSVIDQATGDPTYVPAQ